MIMKYIAIHETAVERTTQPQLWAVNRYHKDKFNSQAKSGYWVGYNEFVDVDGTRTKIRPFGEETCAVVGHNCATASTCDTYSVCFALDGNTQTFNQAQTETWRKIQEEFKQCEITLHKNLQVDRSCPGKLITVEYLKSILTTPINEDMDKLKVAQYMSILDKMRKILTDMLRQTYK